MKNSTTDTSLLPRDIRIDRDGTWYYRDTEMVRKDILIFFYRNLKRDQDGRYLIEYEKDRYYIDVDDTPYVIKSVTFTAEQGDNALYLHMPDDSMEKLDPSTLRVGKDNALYCTIGSNEARFSRASYYEIARYIEHDPPKSVYYISLNGHRYEIGKMEECYT